MVRPTLIDLTRKFFIHDIHDNSLSIDKRLILDYVTILITSVGNNIKITTTIIFFRKILVSISQEIIRNNFYSIVMLRSVMLI